MGKEGRILNPFLKGVILGTSVWMGANPESTDFMPNDRRKSEYLGICEQVKINNEPKLICIKDGRQTTFELK